MDAAQTQHGSPQAGLLVDDKGCLRCHGEKLDGAGLDGQCLIVHPANFQCVTSGSKTDWKLLLTIPHGAALAPMHEFRGKLTDQQVMDVRMMAPFDPLS